MKCITQKSRARRRGITIVELLVAGLLLSIGLMALVNIWSYSFFVTGNTDDKTVAYNLGRQTMERVKQTGFSYVPEGTATVYYTGNQVSQPDASGSRFRVATYVSSDVMSSGTSGQTGAVASQASLRTVLVSVYLTSGGPALYQTTTYMCRAGI